MDIKEDTKIFKALADENRLDIINKLTNGEMCACVLLKELNISQPTLSHHMKILCDSGLVNSYKAGKWVHYSLSKETFKQLVTDLKGYESISDTKCHNHDECL